MRGKEGERGRGTVFVRPDASLCYEGNAKSFSKFNPSSTVEIRQGTRQGKGKKSIGSLHPAVLLLAAHQKITVPPKNRGEKGKGREHPLTLLTLKKTKPIRKRRDSKGRGEDKRTWACSPCPSILNNTGSGERSQGYEASSSSPAMGLSKRS